MESAERTWAAERRPGSPFLHTPSHAAFDYYPRLARLEHYVRTHLAKPITLAEAAAAANLERKYFSKYFRTKVGMTFREWLARQRVERARDLLAGRDCSITEVAFAAGFGDLRTFERWFERVIGCRPSEFKRSAAPTSKDASPAQ